MEILISHLITVVNQRTRKITAGLTVCLILLFITNMVWAGPYSPAAGQPDSSAVSKDDPALVGWAGLFQDYMPGDEVDPTWADPVKALGGAGSEPQDIVSLGRGGRITLLFDPPIKDGPGWDFAVFENSFSDTFLELAHVEASSNGIDFVRFRDVSLTIEPVGGFGNIDPTDIDKLAGTFRQGFGTPFDLRDLAGEPGILSGLVDIARISHVRLVDIIGDGSDTDSAGRIIYDPFPTFGSAGFDLDALGIRYENTEPLELNVPAEKPVLQAPANGAIDTALAPSLETEAFSDANAGDIHLRTRWQISREPDFSDLLFDLATAFHLTSLALPGLVLTESTTYYWRVQFFDNHNTGFGWSEVFSFSTGPDANDLDKDGLPDDQQVEIDWDGDGAADVNIPSVNATDSEGNTAPVGLEPGSNVVSVEALKSIDPALTGQLNRPENLPMGLVGFKVKVADSNLTAQVTIHFSDPVPEGAKWYKYDHISGWREYPRAVFSLDRTSVSLEIKDGDPAYGDVDGLKNGIIVDPGGVGADIVTVPPPDEPAGFENGSGCFIAAVSGDRRKKDRSLFFYPRWRSYLR